MDSVTLFCTAALVTSGIYWFFCVLLGPAKQKNKGALDLSGGSENAKDSYNDYQSFFQRPKEIEATEKVPEFVDKFYNLVTDIFEWTWGQSFHFSPSVAGKSHKDSVRLHEEMAVDVINVKPGQKVLDVGCGIGGPMRAIAAHSKAKVVGITNSEDQVKRAKLYNKKAELDSLCDVVCANFLEIPFKDNTFDGVYSISATCHAPKLEEVYAEIYRVLKPGAMYVSYDWVTTEKYRKDDEEHMEVIQGIERGIALPGLRSYTDIAATARKVGFEIVKEKDLAKTSFRPWSSNIQMSRVVYWRNHVVFLILSAIGILPKGTADVYDMVYKTTDYLTKGGETGIFTPMHMILCRKPEKVSK